MKKFNHLVALACIGTIILLTGCLGPSVSYKGKTFPAVTDAKLLTDKKQMSDYKVIGRCAVSGEYNSCTLADLKKSLLKKANAEGADAVYIRTYEIVKSGEAREDQLLDMTGECPVDDDTSASWEDLENIFGTSYAQMQRDSREVPTFKRVVRAVFLRKKPGQCCNKKGK